MDMAMVIGGGVLMALFSYLSYRNGYKSGVSITTKRVAERLPLIVAMYTAAGLPSVELGDMDVSKNTLQ